MRRILIFLVGSLLWCTSTAELVTQIRESLTKLNADPAVFKALDTIESADDKTMRDAALALLRSKIEGMQVFCATVHPKNQKCAEKQRDYSELQNLFKQLSEQISTQS
jgi:acyl carrier protein phosphodiesterase